MTVGHHTFVGYVPSVPDKTGLRIVDWSVNNEWIRQGTHWFLVHNNSDDTVPSIGVVLQGASPDSPSIGYSHRSNNEVAESIEPLLAGEYRYLPGSLWWKTFGHLREDLTVASFEVGTHAPNLRLRQDPKEQKIRQMYVELFSRRVPLEALGLYIKGGLASVRVQNQSDLRLFQADVELAIHVNRDGSRKQKMFLCSERSSTATLWIEPMQIVEVQFFVDDDVDQSLIEGYVISSFAYRPRRDFEQEPSSASDPGLAFGPGGALFVTKGTDVDAKFDFEPINQQLQTLGESLEREGRWQFKWASRGDLSLQCRTCHRDYEISHSHALHGDGIWCSQCAADSNVVEYVKFEEKVKYKTRTEQIPTSLEVAYPNHPQQRVDIRCLLCSVIEEVSFETLVARRWTCPHCRDGEQWTSARNHVLRKQESLRAQSVQKQRDTESMRDQPKGIVATISRKTGVWLGKRSR